MLDGGHGRPFLLCTALEAVVRPLLRHAPKQHSGRRPCGVPRPLGESEEASWASDEARTPAAAVPHSVLHPLASGIQQPCAQPQHLLPPGCVVVIAHAAPAVCHLSRFLFCASHARRAWLGARSAGCSEGPEPRPALVHLPCPGAATCHDGQGLARTRPRGRIVSEPAEAR
jgi:hypothetical protein